MLTETLDVFVKEKYINLETFKKDGSSVKTPVWFVISDGLIYVITRSKTGKVKRIKNNPTVKLVRCNIKGDPHGEWISGKAKLVESVEAENAIKLRGKRYGLMAKFAGFLSKSKGDLVVFSIKFD